MAKILVVKNFDIKNIKNIDKMYYGSENKDMNYLFKTITFASLNHGYYELDNIVDIKDLSRMLTNLNLENEIITKKIKYLENYEYIILLYQDENLCPKCEGFGSDLLQKVTHLKNGVEITFEKCEKCCGRRKIYWTDNIIKKHYSTYGNNLVYIYLNKEKNEN